MMDECLGASYMPVVDALGDVSAVWCDGVRPYLSKHPVVGQDDEWDYNICIGDCAYLPGVDEQLIVDACATFVHCGAFFDKFSELLEIVDEFTHVHRCRCGSDSCDHCIRDTLCATVQSWISTTTCLGMADTMVGWLCRANDAHDVLRSCARAAEGCRACCEVECGGSRDKIVCLSKKLDRLSMIEKIRCDRTDDKKGVINHGVL